MTWTAVIVLAAVSLGLKAIGPVLLGGRDLPPRLVTLLGLVPVPMLAALVLVGSVADGRHLHADARLPALAVAAVLVWRRAPFLLVICAAAATAALVRLL